MLGSDSQNAFKFAYLKKRDLDVDNFVTYFGRQFAAGWDELRTQPVAAIAQSVARNAVSVGCTLGSLSGDEARVEVLLTGWPDAEEISNLLGLEPYDRDAMWNSFYPIMKPLGIHYTWQREEKWVKLVFEREKKYQRVLSSLSTPRIGRTLRQKPVA